MSAIITSDFRRNNISKILEEISSGSSRYYLGIGKADPWPNESDALASIPNPNTASSTLLDAKSSLIGLKLIESSSTNYMIPNITIKSNRKYKAYDSTDETCFYPTLSGDTTTEYPCYAVYNDKIYLCIYNGKDGGTDIATFTGATLTAHGTIADVYVDGSGDNGSYHWAYISNIKSGSTLDVNEFVEVDASDTDYSPTPSGALDGQVWSARIVDNGATASPTNPNGTHVFTTAVEGDGSGLIGNVVVSGGLITEVTISGHGNSYNKAKINLSTIGLSGEIALSVLPINGVGYEPLKTLPSWYLGMSVKISDTEGGEIPTDVSYRQISIIKDPIITPTAGFINDEDSPYSSPFTTPEITNADALKWLEINTPANYSNNAAAGLAADINNNSVVIIEDSNTGAKGFAVRYDSGTNRIYYYQNNSDSINQDIFEDQNTSGITVDVDGDGSPVGGIDYDNVGTGEYDGTSGEIIFLENRTAISRADSQIEDIRVIMQY